MTNMKKILQVSALMVLITVLLLACDKTDSLPLYGKGKATTLTASTTTVAAAPADSNSTVLTLNWTNPGYATDSSHVKYIVEIDSTGRNFSKSFKREVDKSTSTSFTAKDLNSILLSYGFSFGVSYTMDVRVTSSYANNNESYVSNTIQIKMTPYKVPPLIALPSSGHLYLVGDATQSGWSNPVDTPAQEFTRIDETTWGGVFNLNGGKQYLVLPVNGDWSHKFSVADNSISGLSSGGSFGFDLSSNFPGPATSGWYKIILDFQHGKFTVTPYTTGAIPDSLYIVGDATPGGWNNPVPANQKFTRLNSTDFVLTLPLIGGKQYLLLPLNGDWGHKFAVTDNSIASEKTSGSFLPDASSNFPGPDVSGTYQIYVSFLNDTYTLTKQ